MFKRIKDEFVLLFNSSKFVWVFEITYKLVAIAVIYPLIPLHEDVGSEIPDQRMFREYVKESSGLCCNSAGNRFICNVLHI